MLAAYRYHGAHRAADHDEAPFPVPAPPRRSPLPAALLWAALAAGAVGGVTSSVGMAWMSHVEPVTAILGPAHPSEPAPPPPPPPPPAPPAATPVESLDPLAPSAPAAPDGRDDKDAPITDEPSASDHPAAHNAPAGVPTAATVPTGTAPTRGPRDCPSQLAGAEPHVARAGNFLAGRFDIPLAAITGRDADAADPDVRRGLALDFRVGRGVGDQLAAYAVAHHRQLGVTGVVWRGRSSTDGGPFSLAGDPPNPDDDRDKVHISFSPDPPAVPPAC